MYQINILKLICNTEFSLRIVTLSSLTIQYWWHCLCFLHLFLLLLNNLLCCFMSTPRPCQQSFQFYLAYGFYPYCYSAEICVKYRYGTIGEVFCQNQSAVSTSLNVPSDNLLDFTLKKSLFFNQFMIKIIYYINIICFYHLIKQE